MGFPTIARLAEDDGIGSGGCPVAVQIDDRRAEDMSGAAMDQALVAFTLQQSLDCGTARVAAEPADFIDAILGP